MILIKEKTDANNRKEMKKETRKMTRMMMIILAGDAPSRTAGPAEGQQAYNSTVPLLHGIGFWGSRI